MQDFQHLKMQIGKKLRELRLKKGLTVDVLTGLVNINYANYVRLENAKNNNPGLDILYRLAEFHGVPLNYFLQERGVKTVPSESAGVEKQLLSVFRKIRPNLQLLWLRLMSQTSREK
ncbi:helix-turn-helix domain containing protein [Candidatus Termititenax aidoneus]|uniref:Helix-turn-helix domain containing protein n=1 Tax=Termititenax aidoneus TaxID=2218524 RepID=A0A388T8N1_TERA1|nr:helix-turn-helix domain containing protein [Candidatus Termititenax aidoneus]